MAKKKQKYYVVWEGVQPGIYDTWNQCQLQIKGFPGARFKSFPSKKEAEEAFLSSATDYIIPKKKKDVKRDFDRSGIIRDSLSVDAACSGSPGIMEYRGVWTKDSTEVFRRGPYEWGTNNVGEFLALVHGIAFLKKHGLDNMTIYSDSRTAMSWLRNKKVKTTLERRNTNTDLFVLLERAEKWVQTNQWSNPVIKWETKKWGEIPADFGRK